MNFSDANEQNREIYCGHQCMSSMDNNPFRSSTHRSSGHFLTVNQVQTLLTLLMGGSASLLQIPHDVLHEAETVKCLGGNKSNLDQIQLSSEVLANVRRRSYSYSDSFKSGSSKRKVDKAIKYEVPMHVKQLLEKIGIKSTPSTTKGYNTNTKRLVAHVFDCLEGLQHLVKADQAIISIEEGLETQTETRSVIETNRECVGQLLHEMIALYTLCGDTVKVLLLVSPEAARVEDEFGRLPLHVAVDRDKPWMDAVGRLINAYPEALSRRDGGGLLPLHIAVDRQEPNIDGDMSSRFPPLFWRLLFNVLSSFFLSHTCAYR